MVTAAQELVIGGAVALVGAYAYAKFAETEPFLAGIALGAGAVIFLPSVYKWAVVRGQQVRVAYRKT